MANVSISFSGFPVMVILISLERAVWKQSIINNKNSDTILSNIFYNKTTYLGFHLNHPYFKEEIIKPEQTINHLRFFCIGGLNSISRKHIDLIVKIFYDGYDYNLS